MIKEGQTKPANCRTVGELTWVRKQPHEVQWTHQSLHLSSIMLVGGTTNPNWSWQI